MSAGFRTEQEALRMSGFEESLGSGPHCFLARLTGAWRGTARTWFEPGKLADESPIEGAFRPVLDRRFMLHEYRGSLQAQPLSGMAMHGYDLSRRIWTVSWIDSFHMSTGIMLSESEADDRIPAGDIGAFYVLGHYYGGNERWGWRTTLELIGEDRLMITHDNITPAGDSAKAVEIVYERSSS